MTRKLPPFSLRLTFEERARLEELAGDEPLGAYIKRKVFDGKGDVRGFMADDVAGALSEVDAVAKGTKCRQPLFSVSLNPPPNETVRIETFDKAIRAARQHDHR